MVAGSGRFDGQSNKTEAVGCVAASAATLRKLRMCAARWLVLACWAVVPAGLSAQPMFDPSSQLEPFEQLAAPVALFDDQLLLDVFMAATQPVQVLAARAWLRLDDHAVLRGDQLAQALDQQQWDPAVKALVAVPPALDLLADHFAWMSQLGQAYQSQPQALFAAVQRLRWRALDAGTLASGPYQSVETQSDAVVIGLPNPVQVFVPVYDPWCAYGGWHPSPGQQPAFAPWHGNCPSSPAPLHFGRGIQLPFSFQSPAPVDWPRRTWRPEPRHQPRRHPAKPQGGVPAARGVPGPLVPLRPPGPLLQHGGPAAPAGQERAPIVHRPQRATPQQAPGTQPAR